MSYYHDAVDDRNYIADYSNALTVSDPSQPESYPSSSSGWDSTSEHGNWNYSLHRDQVPVENYPPGIDPGFDLAAQGSYEYLFNTGYRRLHENSVCGAGILHGEVGGGIPSVDPQLDINEHFLRPVVRNSESSQAATARYNPVGLIPQLRHTSRVRPRTQGLTGTASQQTITLSEEDREEIMNRMVEYFFAIRPMHSAEEDNTYMMNVVAGFFDPNNQTWKRSKWYSELKKSIKRAWHDIVRHFKDVARTSIYTCYPALQVPINQRCDLAQEWKPVIDDLLSDWKYTDLVVLQGDQDLLVFPFHHMALTTIIHQVIWVKPTYHARLPSNDQGSDGLVKVVAFACAILHWAILSLQQGAEPDFDTRELTPIYNNALARLTSLDATYLDLYFADIRARGSELQRTYE